MRVTDPSSTSSNSTEHRYPPCSKFRGHRSCCRKETSFLLQTTEDLPGETFPQQIRLVFLLCWEQRRPRYLHLSLRCEDTIGASRFVFLLAAVAVGAKCTLTFLNENPELMYPYSLPVFPIHPFFPELLYDYRSYWTIS